MGTGVQVARVHSEGFHWYSDPRLTALCDGGRLIRACRRTLRKRGCSRRVELAAFLQPLDANSKHIITMLSVFITRDLLPRTQVTSHSGVERALKAQKVCVWRDPLKVFLTFCSVTAFY